MNFKHISTQKRAPRSSVFRGTLQICLGERLNGIQEVSGSIPLISAKKAVIRKDGCSACQKSQNRRFGDFAYPSFLAVFCVKMVKNTTTRRDFSQKMRRTPARRPALNWRKNPAQRAFRQPGQASFAGVCRKQEEARLVLRHSAPRFPACTTEFVASCRSLCYAVNIKHGLPLPGSSPVSSPIF